MDEKRYLGQQKSRHDLYRISLLIHHNKNEELFISQLLGNASYLFLLALNIPIYSPLLHIYRHQDCLSIFYSPPSFSTTPIFVNLSVVAPIGYCLPAVHRIGLSEGAFRAYTYVNTVYHCLNFLYTELMLPIFENWLSANVTKESITPLDLSYQHRILQLCYLEVASVRIIRILHQRG